MIDLDNNIADFKRPEHIWRDVFSVYDKKLEEYGRPFIDNNVGTAVRGFGQACGQEGQYKTFPYDYDLFHIGKYDLITGKFENFDIPRQVSRASDFVQPQGANENGK